MAKNSRFSKKNNSKIHIFGHHAAIAALKNENRDLKRLIMSENASKLIDKKLLSKVKKIEIISNKEFNNRFNNDDENKQGIILETSNLISSSFSSILEKTSKEKYSILLMLDQIQNPQNIGSIIRSAALFNCKAVITSKNNSPDMNSSIVKSSSGATEVVEYIKVGNLVQSINEAKKSGFWIIGLEQNENITLDKFDIPKKCVFILGSEHRGLRNLTKENCDHLVSINFFSNNNFNIDSLNVSNAAAIALYEYRKKIND